MNSKRKDRLRRWIRVLMVFIAALLLVMALVIPVINNFIAAGVADDLEALPLPADTTLVDSVSLAGKSVGSGNGMQYFGAVLLHSDLSLAELQSHYMPYQKGLFDCRVAAQSGAEVTQITHGSLAFDATVEGDGWYILYSWGSAPAWARDWLNLDMRGN